MQQNLKLFKKNICADLCEFSITLGGDELFFL